MLVRTPETTEVLGMLADGLLRGEVRSFQIYDQVELQDQADGFDKSKQVEVRRYALSVNPRGVFLWSGQFEAMRHFFAPGIYPADSRLLPALAPHVRAGKIWGLCLDINAFSGVEELRIFGPCTTSEVTPRYSIAVHAHRDTLRRNSAGIIVQAAIEDLYRKLARA